ncbi:hypothetical protein IT407_04670 [Candidatus Uhrbacteria bacterium]|nr:hypothetical protein [Candidatus Uhrbacteria bacterium]
MSERIPKESPKSPDKPEKRQQMVKLYHLDQQTHAILKKYPAHFLAKGGEHFVYEIGSKETGDLRDVVVKGSAQMAQVMTRELEDKGVEKPSDLPFERQEIFKRYLHEDEQKYLALRKTFGADHVMPQRRYIMNVPINEDIAEEIFGEESDKEDCWTLVTLQKRAKELSESKFAILDMGTEYVERSPVGPSEYARGKAESSLDRRSSILLMQAMKDPQLREQVEDFVKKAVTYTENEHEILDLIGSRNVYFYKKEQDDGTSRWSYRILDGFYAKPRIKILDKAKAAIGYFEEHGELKNKSEANVLMNALAYARSINAMAKSLGLKERVDILDDVKEETIEKLLNEIRKKTDYVDPNMTQKA